MRIDKLFMGVVILLIFLTGGILIINEQVDEYDLDVDTESESSFIHTQEYVADLNASIETMRPIFDRGEEDIELRDTFGFLLTAATGALRITWTMIKVPGALARDFYVLLGLPQEMQIFFMLGLLVLILFSFVYLYFRFQPR
ncbi:hypothetical protein LCGC14_0867820 [marine sediment metagenome]|uniref:Uncharacterized protein n=1 Tax=marine sediment metagenome TaxID=412755 RepID=A0A0F9PR83_9ZZZZ